MALVPELDADENVVVKDQATALLAKAPEVLKVMVDAQVLSIFSGFATINSRIE